MSRFRVLVVIVLITCLAQVESARILGLFPSFSKSHLIVYMAVMQPLIERGHDVTIVTSLPLTEKNPKYRHILLDLPTPSLDALTDRTDKSILSMINKPRKMISQMLIRTNMTLYEPKMQKLMAEASFDLVVLGYFMNDLLIGVAGHFKCPLALIWTGQPSRSLNSLVGNPAEIFYVPQTMSGTQQPLGFKDRIKNFLFSIMEIVFFSVVKYQMEIYYNHAFPSDKYLSFEEMRKNVSLLLVNTYLNQGSIRPNVPGLIQIGGIQVKPKADPLPEDIKMHLDSASKHGAIYFCLGSNLNSSHMKPDMISAVYKVLSTVKQNVIWKWDDEEKLPGNAPNILFKKWLPQDDILAHPNVKLFVTHGGQGGMAEAGYHGVPMVGIPFFADQFSNLNAAEKFGYGISFGTKNVTETLFREAVKEVLENSTYRDTIKGFSKIFQDRPLSARDNAAFWLEYVIRHRGAKHLQSPAVHLNTLQYYGIDVIGFLLITIYIVCKLVGLLFRKTVCKLFKRNAQKKSISNNKKYQ